jgi:aminoglycoside 2'-N-acetyltransferase I
MSAARLRVAQTDELEPERFAELTALCEAAFAEPFAPVWERVGPGLHVTADVGGRIVAHAMIVDRPLYLEHETDVAVDAGYVENVATLPEAQGRGHGAHVLREVNRIIGDEYAIGALATGTHGHYARLGWERWTGPAWVRMADGLRVRSAGSDGSIMILRTRRTPEDLDLAGPIAVDWRSGDPW